MIFSLQSCISRLASARYIDMLKYRHPMCAEDYVERYSWDIIKITSPHNKVQLQLIYKSLQRWTLTLMEKELDCKLSLFAKMSSPFRSGRPDSRERWKSNVPTRSGFRFRRPPIFPCGNTFLAEKQSYYFWYIKLKLKSTIVRRTFSRSLLCPNGKRVGIRILRVWALAGAIVLCSWVRHLNLTVPLIT